jgi:hypothetical protein
MEYNNDELSDVWDMEMVSGDAPLVTKPIDTLKKDTSKKTGLPAIPPAKPKPNKDSALNTETKKKKIQIKKKGPIKKKALINTNVNNI